MIHKESDLVVLILNLHSEVNLSLFKERTRESYWVDDYFDIPTTHESARMINFMIKNSIFAYLYECI